MVTPTQIVIALGLIGVCWICTLVGMYLLGKSVGWNQALDSVEDGETVDVLEGSQVYGWEGDTVSRFPEEFEGWETRRATDTDWRRSYQVLAPDDAETLLSFRQWARRMTLYISTIARDVLSEPVTEPDDSDIDVWPESEYPSPAMIPVPDWALNTGELPAIAVARERREIA